jgi:hypothetical protein
MSLESIPPNMFSVDFPYDFQEASAGIETAQTTSGEAPYDGSWLVYTSYSGGWVGWDYSRDQKVDASMCGRFSGTGDWIASQNVPC